ncbi:MAG: MBL fold metallo-hydrolase [Spirochaetaceae bacterium]|jgi:glyoxylase-like metal-dependent hydrolase (beta-lactamase superfamily II)|nr:MBL fold metallo-hydrolase [Spirochaetaceae bacterium]
MSNVFSFQIGVYIIYTMLEAQGPGNAGILINPDKADVDKYLKGGFQHATNTFLVQGQGKNVLIDTGFGTNLFNCLKEIGVAPEKIDAIFLTHMHGDHIGGMQKDGKALFPNAKVYLSEIEKEYWTVTNQNRGAIAALDAYKGRVETFKPGALGNAPEVLVGITGIASYGHTPGHTSYSIKDGGKELIVWGDLMHVELIQFPVPSQAVTYDTDPKAATTARLETLQYAAQTGTAIAGHHLLFPAIGTVSAAGDGYLFNHE